MRKNTCYHKTSDMKTEHVLPQNKYNENRTLVTTKNFSVNNAVATDYEIMKKEDANLRMKKRKRKRMSPSKTDSG